MADSESRLLLLQTYGRLMLLTSFQWPSKCSYTHHRIILAIIAMILILPNPNLIGLEVMVWIMVIVMV